MGVVSSATVITMISVTVYRMIFSLRVDLLSKLFLKKHKSLMTTLIVQVMNILEMKESYFRLLQTI